jgi:hydrogenase nickel insertion protein HypA
MHEMSLMLSLWDVVESEVKQNNYLKVHNVEVEIGDYLGVIDEFLQSCFEAVKIQAEYAKGAQLKIAHITSKIKCNNCQNSWNYKDHLFFCPNCGHADSEVYEGNELNILSMDVDT